MLKVCNRCKDNGAHPSGKYIYLDLCMEAEKGNFSALSSELKLRSEANLRTEAPKRSESPN